MGASILSTRFCKDCEFYQAGSDTPGGFLKRRVINTAKCTQTRFVTPKQVDLVTGKVITPEIIQFSDPYAARALGGFCGPEAKEFVRAAT